MRTLAVGRSHGNRGAGFAEKEGRKAAPKEERVGKTCESNEWERTSQICANFYERLVWETRDMSRGFLKTW